MFLSPTANDLDKLALMVARADRFTPGTRDGAPVVVGQSLELEIKSCVTEVKDSAGNKSYTVQMRAMPEQRLGRFTEPHGLVPLFPSEVRSRNSMIPRYIP